MHSSHFVPVVPTLRPQPNGMDFRSTLSAPERLGVVRLARGRHDIPEREHVETIRRDRARMYQLTRFDVRRQARS